MSSTRIERIRARDRSRGLRCTLAVAVAGLLSCQAPSRFPDEIPFTSLLNERAAQALELRLEEGEDRSARYELVRIYLEELMFERSIEHLEALVRGDAKDEDAHILLAFVHRRKHRPDPQGALNALTRGRSATPGSSRIAAHLALERFERGEFEETRRECRHALRASTADPRTQAAALLLLAAVHEAKGEYVDAARSHAAALLTDPSIVAARTSAIEVLVRPDLDFEGTHPDTLGRAQRGDARGRPEGTPR